MGYDTKYTRMPIIWPKESVYTIKKFTGSAEKGSTLKEGAALCLKYHLYVRGWMLSKFMKDILENRVSKLLTLHIMFRDTTPIGIIFVRKFRSQFRNRKTDPVCCDVSIFIKPDYRRKGYGRILINEVKKEFGTKISWTTGSKGSEKFFSNCVGE
jgi:GNAT superfamily N-acetyltransferase